MTDSVPPPSGRAPATRALGGARWILACAILGSALALGSLHTMVLAVVAGVLGLATVLAWWYAEPIRVRPAATVLVLVAVGLCVFTALQCIPLPIAWVAALNPGAADVWTRALSPLREPGPTLATLSLDPIATRVQVLRGITYLCTFLVALRVSHRREGAIFLERTLAVASVTMAVAALLHPALGAQRVFGTYQPMVGSGFAPRHIAPLLNPNHLAGSLNIGLCVALGMTLSAASSTPRSISIAAALFLAGVEVWVASRGGVLAMVAGILLVIALSRLATKPERGAIVSKIVPGILVLAGVVTAVLFAGDQVWHELSNTDSSKLELFRQAFRVPAHFPLFGIGRGSFESVFPAFRTGVGYDVFTHPENVVAQWAAEWGLPVALAGAGGLFYALRPATVLARSRPAIGAWGALACLALHNLVDFSSEVPGVMIALAVCAALVVAGTGGGAAARRFEGWPKRPRVLSVMALAVVAGAIAVVVPGIPRELNTEQSELHERAIDPSEVAEDFHAALRGAMLDHPAEPYFPFVGAVRAARARDESVVPWVARALERSPVYGRAHLLLARGLYLRSPAQARLEYRLAIEQEPFMSPRVLAEAPGLVSSFDQAMEVVPLGAQGVQVLEGLVPKLEIRLPSTSYLLDAELLRRQPDAVPPSRRAAQRALDDVNAAAGAPWCADDRPGCLRKVLALRDRLVALAPSDCDARVLRAQILIQSGETKRALDELEAAMDEVENRLLCTQRLVTLARETHDDERMTRVVERLRRTGCTVEEECVSNLLYLAQAEEARGSRHRALGLYQSAHERAPERDDIVADVARIASSLGLHGEAIDAYGSLARKHPAETRWAEAILVEKQALSRGIYPKERPRPMPSASP